MNLADQKARAFSLRSAVISVACMALVAVLVLLGEPAWAAYLLPIAILAVLLLLSWLPYRRFQRAAANSAAAVDR